MDDLTKKQLELMKTATPAQKAQIATQNAIIRHQIKNPPVELPIDPEAEKELESKDAKPGKGGKKSRRAKSKRSKTSRKRRLSRRR